MRRALIIGTVLLVVGSLLTLRLVIPRFTQEPIQTIETDILVFGSGLGGTSAAIIAAERGANVVLATESPVIGGQAVEAGVSAFDDLDKPWEQWGLYLDLQKYLQEKVGSKQVNHSGLGEAVVGRVASMPADIEGFFRSRITEKKNITLLTEHTLLATRRTWWPWGEWKEADLLNTRTNQKVRVRFTYLVDGTSTGRVLAHTKTPFRVGFDTKEETDERPALTADQRWAFIKGMEWKGKRIGGFGNRIQAVTSPFALLDRGYPGDFIPVTAPAAPCRPPATASGFILGSQLFALGNPACTARIPVHPEFSDVYDIYLIHHGGGAVSSTILSPQWPEDPLVLPIALPPQDTFTYLGAFSAGPDSGMTILVASSVQRILIEGVILIKRNVAPAHPLVFRSPLSEKITLNAVNPAPVRADIYVTNWNPSSAGVLTLDNQPLLPTLSGALTQRFLDVPIRNTSHLTLSPSLRSAGASLIVIPKAPHLASLTFRGDAPDREIAVSELETDSTLSKAALPVREWSFVSPEDGNAFFLIESNSPSWWLLELWDDELSKRVKALSFVANTVTRNPRPLFAATLRKGNRYRLRMGVSSGNVWSDFSWAISFRESSALLEAARDSSLTVPPQGYEGMYDLWIKAPMPSDSFCTLKRPQNPDRTWPILVRHAQYEYAGKAYLDRSTTLSASEEVTSILAIPNPNVDTFVHAVPHTVSPEPPQFSTLPPGQYRAILTRTLGAPATIAAALEGITVSQSLSFPSQTTLATPQQSPDSLRHNGRVLTLTLPRDTTIVRLFEEIPDLSESWSFSMSHHPLIGNIHQVPVPLFHFRNIVAPLNLIEGKTGLEPKYLGRATAGVALVINPSNDYASVGVEDIDSPNLIVASRARSAAYAYWMKYDAALTQQNLGCDPASLPCSPKRTQLVVGLFGDPLGLFPPQPYIRESRRLLTARIVGEKDVSPALSTCGQDSCPQDCLPIPDAAELCLLKIQEPLLFRDALAAVGYVIDIHAFYSLTEYYYDGVKDLLAAIREKDGGVEPPLLVPVWTLKYSRPAEVPLSALLARDGGNVFPASNNIGISQIANGLYRTHANELAIGQAVGSLLAAAIQQNVSPSAFQDSRLRLFQHALVEQGFVLYPVEDMMDDVLLRTGVQHLILEGLLTPAAVLPEDGPSVWGTIAYRISPKSSVNERDLPVVQALFPAAVPEPLTYRHLLSLVQNTPTQVTDERLKQSGLHLGLIDASHRSLATDKLLESTPSKGDLYRTASLLLRTRRTSEQK